MYSVLIVDDEPRAVKYLQTLVGKCENFEVCGTAGNGMEALQKIENLKPDMVLSDIRMPIMDGLGLAEKLYAMEERPILVLVSGYAEFTYAQQAVQLGVMDYILKPVVPSVMKETMSKLEQRLDKIWYGRRKELLRLMCNGKGVDESQMKEAFSSGAFYPALVRYGGMPVLYQDIKSMELFSETGEPILMYGRDEKEAFYLCPAEAFQYEEFEQILNERIRKEKIDQSYYTLVIKDEPVEAIQLPNLIPAMYRILDKGMILGKSQNILYREGMERALSEVYKEEKAVLEMYEKVLMKGDIRNAREELMKLLFDMNEDGCSEFQIRKFLGRCCYLLQRYQILSVDAGGEDEALWEAFYYAGDMKELWRYVDEILFYGVQEKEEFQKLDTEEYFHTVTDFIEKHFREPLTLQLACRRLGISQSYLSKIIRKYSKESFNSYLTKIRIQHALHLMENMIGNIRISDVAELCGFHDPFYFSKVFLSCVGVRPQEYVNSLKMEKNKN